MNVEQLLAALTPEIVARFRAAVKWQWPDGRIVTPEQRRNMHASCGRIEFKLYLPEEQRTGYIDRGAKKKDESCDSPTHTMIQRDIILMKSVHYRLV